ncbi:MAG: hypothetical protein KC478_01880 [Bacteriovoracaceae bacterium]|nr:hypothetical protein [Bacteriovoracaceae bacterium]
MKLVLSLLAGLFIGTNAFAFTDLEIELLRKASKADFFCTDKNVIVEYSYDGEVPEVGEFDLSIFNNKHTLSIRTSDKRIDYTSLVGIATDGFGNDIIQVLEVGDYFSLYEIVADFTFEHEGAYLAGTLVIDEKNYHLDQKFECNLDSY